MEPYICDKMKYFVCLLLELDEVYHFNLYLFSPINIFFCLHVMGFKPKTLLIRRPIMQLIEYWAIWPTEMICLLFTSTLKSEYLFKFFHTGLCRLSDINNFLDRSRTFQAATIVERSTWIFFFYKLLNSIESLKQSYLGK